jgi:hypothetical protein
MGIPVCNKLLVHLMDGLEGPPCIADDIGVREMGVRYEPLIHFATVKYSSYKSVTAIPKPHPISAVFS